MTLKVASSFYIILEKKLTLDDFMQIIQSIGDIIVLPYPISIFSILTKSTTPTGNISFTTESSKCRNITAWKIQTCKRNISKLSWGKKLDQNRASFVCLNIKKIPKKPCEATLSLQARQDSTKIIGIILWGCAYAFSTDRIFHLFLWDFVPRFFPNSCANITITVQCTNICSKIAHNVQILEPRVLCCCTHTVVWPWRVVIIQIVLNYLLRFVNAGLTWHLRLLPRKYWIEVNF